MPGSDVPVLVAVEYKRAIAPRDVDRIAGQLARDRDAAEASGVAVVSNWLGPRTREKLVARGVNFIDLTGNVSLVLENPMVALEAEGADKDPSPQPASVRGLSGPKGGVIARTLADVLPPYSVADLAEAMGLSASFVSRVLTGLERLGIVERTRRGGVKDVDVRALIERWSRDYAVFESNECDGFIAPGGPRDFEASLAAAGEETWAITGSLGASRIAPVAGPALAVAYADDPRGLGRKLGLLPTEVGANVILAAPFDPVVYARSWQRDGIRYVSPSQLAVDCLTGSGRMPSEGAELLRWMSENEQAWRATGLDQPAPFESA